MKPPKDSPIVHAEELMKLSEEVAQGVYELTNTELQDVVWKFDFKARYNGTEIVAGVAAACSDVEPQGALFRLGHVRTLLYELHSTLRLAHRTKRFSTNPELMLAIERMTRLLDEEIGALPYRAKAWHDARGNEKIDTAKLKSAMNHLKEASERGEFS
jgi:hypothetical protein